MLLPFVVGHSAPASVLQHLLPGFANVSLPSGSHGSHHGYHQLYGAENLHGNLLFKLLQPGGSLQNLCLVPLLIGMNLLVALLMQYIARRTRIQAAGPRNEQKPEERYSGVAAFLRDFAGIQSVYKIAKGWLTHDAYRCVSTSLCLLTIAHWFLREWTYAQLLSSLTADLTNAIVAVRSTRDLSLVYSRLFSMLAWQIATAPLFLILDPMIQAWFASSLQSYITNSMLQSYISGGSQAYYKLKMDDEKRDLDNPDQRISESAEQFAFLMYVLFSGFLSAVFGMLAWAGVMIQLGGYALLATCMGMACLRLMLSISLFGNALVDAFKDQLETGATFRYSLARLREHAEPVALAHGDQVEAARSRHHFNSHIDALRCNAFISMLFSTTLGIVDFFPVVILWLYQVPQIEAGVLNFGDALRCQTGYMQVAKVMDFLANSYAKLKQLQANGERLWQLWEAADEVNEEPPADSVIDFAACDTDVAFAFTSLFVFTPGGTTAVGGVSLACEAGKGLLITGGSGIGKSSILRALVGLWSAGEGVVEKSPGAEVIFLPQNSYFPVGTLLEAVIYPAQLTSFGWAERSGLEESATRALKRALLQPLLRRWGLQETRDWSALLSAGERQRLAFARLFLMLALRGRSEERRNSRSSSGFHKAKSATHLSASGIVFPRVARSFGNELYGAGQKDGPLLAPSQSRLRFNELKRQSALSLGEVQQASALCGDFPSTGVIAVLDESTSAVEVSMEEQLYKELQKELKRGSLLAMTSVSHRPSLPKFHHTELLIGEPAVSQRASQPVLQEGVWLTPHGKEVPWKHVTLEPAPEQIPDATELFRTASDSQDSSMNSV